MIAKTPKDIEWSDCHFCGDGLYANSEDPRPDWYADGDEVLCHGKCGLVGRISCDGETDCSVMFEDAPEFQTEENEP